jgi:tRNA(Ile)-lysidine synthase
LAVESGFGRRIRVFWALEAAPDTVSTAKPGLDGQVKRAGAAGLATRDAVRRALADLRTGETVLVACSGGPDSLALASATAFVASRLGLTAGAVVVDHGLQTGSADVAARTAATCRTLGLDPVDIVTVDAAAMTGEGPEAAARAARYAALDAAADRHGAAAVLLGHTRDDQAESVLLGLLRGSGARSLAGMASRRDRYRRPLLGLTRDTTGKACAEIGLEPWADPHNDDPAYARARARQLLRELEERLGDGVAPGLARSADLLRADDEALQAWADDEYAALTGRGLATAKQGLDCAAIAALPQAVRTRVLRRAAIDAGVRTADLSSAHLAALDALVVGWHGQGPVHLPGPVRGVRDCGRLLLATPTTPDPSAETAEE